MKYRKSGRDVWNFIKKIVEVGHLQSCFVKKKSIVKGGREAKGPAGLPSGGKIFHFVKDNMVHEHVFGSILIMSNLLKNG